MQQLSYVRAYTHPQTPFFCGGLCWWPIELHDGSDDDSDDDGDDEGDGVPPGV